MNVTAIPKAANWLSPDEYLEGERLTDVRHEHVDGHVQERDGDGLVPAALQFKCFFGDEPSPPLFAYLFERALCIGGRNSAAAHLF